MDAEGAAGIAASSEEDRSMLKSGIGVSIDE